MTVAMHPSTYMLPPLASLASSPINHRSQYQADGFWSGSGPSTSPSKLDYSHPYASELSSALESVSLAASSKSKATPLKVPSMKGATHLRRSPRSRSLHPYADRKIRHPPTTFVAQNTGDMICYLWFSTNLGLPKSPRARRAAAAAQSPDDHWLSQEQAELARLQFSPSSHFISFLGSLLSTTQVSQGVIILSLHYVYRLKLRNPHIRGMEGSEFRLAVTALMLANKFLDDNTYTNKTWSDVSGITLHEINLMEREFLHGIDHCLYIDHATYQHWGKLLNGLLLAKEQDAQSWRRRTSRHIKHVRLSPTAPRTHHFDPYSTMPVPSRRHSQRARSTSPQSSHVPTAPYPFTFAAPPIPHSNPFTPANVKEEPIDDNYSTFNPSPTRPSTNGIKRTAIDAFSPPPMAPLKVAKRDDLTLSTSNLIPPRMDIWDSRSSTVIDSPMELTSVDGVASAGSRSPMSMYNSEPEVEQQPRTLQAPFVHGNGRPSAMPQYLTFNALASSPLGSPNEFSVGAGAGGARKTVLRYHEPRVSGATSQYVPHQQLSSNPPLQFSRPNAHPYTQSARTSPRDDILPTSAYPRETYMNSITNDNQQPQHTSPRRIDTANCIQPTTSISASFPSLPPPHPTARSYSGRAAQLAPFANAGPAGVHVWASSGSFVSIPTPVNQHNKVSYDSRWRGVGATEMGSPVTRGRRM